MSIERLGGPCARRVKARFQMMISTCQLADSESTLDHVFRLRYAGYRRSGAIDDRPDERFRDRDDDLPNHFSFLIPDFFMGPGMLSARAYKTVVTAFDQLRQPGKHSVWLAGADEHLLKERVSSGPPNRMTLMELALLGIRTLSLS